MLQLQLWLIVFLNSKTYAYAWKTFIKEKPPGCLAWGGSQFKWAKIMQHFNNYLPETKMKYNATLLLQLPYIRS